MDMDAHATHAPPKPQLPQIARFSTVARFGFVAETLRGAALWHFTRENTVPK